MDAYMEVGGRATQDAKAEVIGTTPGKEEVELRREQQPRATQEAKAEGCYCLSSAFSIKQTISYSSNMFTPITSLYVQAKCQETVLRYG